MNPTPWKKLVRDLSDEGYKSPYLDRLRTRIDVEQAHNELEAEILREMACALGRSEDRVNLALLQLELIDGEIEALLEGRPGPEWPQRVNERIDAFNAQRRAAERSLWELVIHREALGFRRNEILKRFYPIPPPRRHVR